MGTYYSGGKVKVDSSSVSNAITAVLRDYTDEVANKVIAAADEIATEAVKKLKATSPSDNRDVAYHYKNAWQKKRIKFKYAQAVRYKISNKAFWLTHLLEYGHITRNGERTTEQPHIKPVEEWAIEEFEKRVKEAAKG